MDRDKGASRIFTLQTNTKLPPQKVVLTVTDNKKQLITSIVNDLIAHKDEFNGRLVVTGPESAPIELNSNVVIRRHDMATTHEEADTILIHHINAVNASEVIVVADDTDVFVLLCHFVCYGKIKSHVRMVSPVRGRTFIDISATVQRHPNVMPHLLAAHGLTGCDTVATYFGIGKMTVLKVLQARDNDLTKLGDTVMSLSDSTQQAVQFLLSCYGQPNCSTMTEARHKTWSKKVASSVGGSPKLKTLPPTDDACKQNVARAHLQVAIWRQALEPDPPTLDPCRYGWGKEEGNNTLWPVTVAENVPLAPAELLQMIRCSCSGASPCKTQRCGCQSAGLPCTIFCACHSGQSERCFKLKEPRNPIRT